MSNILVFALIGLLTGAAARLFYPGRQPMRILGTLAVGMAGALIGGVISWTTWPAVTGQFQVGNLLMSMLAAILVLVLWAGVAYARSLNRVRNT